MGVSTVHHSGRLIADVVILQYHAASGYGGTLLCVLQNGSRVGRNNFHFFFCRFFFLAI